MRYSEWREFQRTGRIRALPHAVPYAPPVRLSGPLQGYPYGPAGQMITIDNPMTTYNKAVYPNPSDLQQFPADLSWNVWREVQGKSHSLAAPHMQLSRYIADEKVYLNNRVPPFHPSLIPGLGVAPSSN